MAIWAGVWPACREPSRQPAGGGGRPTAAGRWVVDGWGSANIGAFGAFLDPCMAVMLPQPKDSMKPPLQRGCSIGVLGSAHSMHSSQHVRICRIARSEVARRLFDPPLVTSITLSSKPCCVWSRRAARQHGVLTGESACSAARRHAVRLALVQACGRAWHPARACRMWSHSAAAPYCSRTSRRAASSIFLRGGGGHRTRQRSQIADSPSPAGCRLQPPKQAPAHAASPPHPAAGAAPMLPVSLTWIPCSLLPAAQYTWIFAISVIVGFAESFGIGANDLVRTCVGRPLACWHCTCLNRARQSLPACPSATSPACMKPSTAIHCAGQLPVLQATLFRLESSCRHPLSVSAHPLLSPPPAHPHPTAGQRLRHVGVCQGTEVLASSGGGINLRLPGRRPAG